MGKNNTSKLSIIILCIALITSLSFLCKAYWDIYNPITGWKNELWARSGYAATLQALSDFRNGKLKLLKIEGRNESPKFSGQKEGPFEIWIVQYYPLLGNVHKFSQETYIEFYNRKMKYMQAHPNIFKTKEETSNESVELTEKPLRDFQ